MTIKAAATRQSASRADIEALKKLRVLIRAAQRHSGWIEKQCGVSGAQLWVMQELSDRPGLRVGEIAQRLAIQPTTASNLLDGLVKGGLVLKMRGESDQRVVTLTLSQNGARLMRRAPKPARGLLQEALARLDQKSLRQLNAGLQALIDVAGMEDESLGLQPFSFNM